MGQDLSGTRSVLRAVTGGLRAGVSKSIGAFTLVEVVLALGVMSFALLCIFSLLPMGLTIFRQSIDISVGAQVIQRVLNEAQETEFDQLIKDASTAPIPAGSTGVKLVRYFDDQGNELPGPTGAIYHVNTRIQPATAFPASTPVLNTSVATVTVQVANNPGNLTLDYDVAAGMTNLWSGKSHGSPAGAANVPILISSTFVSR